MIKIKRKNFFNIEDEIVLIWEMEISLDCLTKSQSTAEFKPRPGECVGCEAD